MYGDQPTMPSARRQADRGTAASTGPTSDRRAVIPGARPAVREHRACVAAGRPARAAASGPGAPRQARAAVVARAVRPGRAGPPPRSPPAVRARRRRRPRPAQHRARGPADRPDPSAEAMTNSVISGRDEGAGHQRHRRVQPDDRPGDPGRRPHPVERRARPPAAAAAAAARSTGSPPAAAAGSPPCAGRRSAREPGRR